MHFKLRMCKQKENTCNAVQRDDINMEIKGKKEQSEKWSFNHI